MFQLLFFFFTETFWSVFADTFWSFVAQFFETP